MARTLGLGEVERARGSTPLEWDGTVGYARFTAPAADPLHVLVEVRRRQAGIAFLDSCQITPVGRLLASQSAPMGAMPAAAS